MVDIHSHILPGIDDGAEDVYMALDMARQAVSDGISAVIATPHHGNGAFYNEGASIVQQVADLNQLLLSADIPLTVYPGMEIHDYRGWLDDFLDGRLLRLNGTRYILLEFSWHSIEKYDTVSNIDDLMHELRLVECIPVIAHPERHPAFYKDPKKLNLWLERGALAQLTAKSVTGRFGTKTKEFSDQLIKSGAVHFVASDAHNLYERTLTLSDAYSQISAMHGTETSERFKANARNLLDNLDIASEFPKNTEKRWFFFKK